MMRGQILQEFDFAIEVNQKRFVFFLRKHLVKKSVARVALLIEHIALTPTGIHKQA